MLSIDQLEKLRQTIKDYSKEELVWASGYIKGFADARSPLGADASPLAQTASVVKKATVLYATETGNSKKVAFDFAQKAKAKGIQIKVASMDSYRAEGIANEAYCFFIMSTHGDGEVPDMGKKFFAYIHENEPDLSKMKFAVLGLGDTSYPEYCKAAEDARNRLVALKANELLPLEKCDVDFQETADEWIQKAIDALSASKAAPTILEKTDAPIKPTKKIYKGEVTTHINLNDIDSDKETYHVEIDAGEDIHYEAGDALAIIPPNKKGDVERLLSLIPLDPNMEIETSRGKKGTLKDLLLTELNIYHLLPSAMKKIRDIVGEDLGDDRMDVIDIINKKKIADKDRLTSIIQTLSPIAPRLYSISSSPSMYATEAHITVAQNVFSLGGELRLGACSSYIAHWKPKDKISFYIQKNNQFKLPADDKDIILIGPGTGIAPMRSFLQERESRGSSGRNWLFFGDRRFVCDFLYQTEIQTWLELGVLSRLSLAFSRDQKEKYYVQHEMLKEQKELYDWISSGAYIFVCGEKEKMAKDVENTLVSIVSGQSAKPVEEAAQYLKQLQEEGRYLKDVY